MYTPASGAPVYPGPRPPGAPRTQRTHALAAASESRGLGPPRPGPLAAVRPAGATHVGLLGPMAHGVGNWRLFLELTAITFFFLEPRPGRWGPGPFRFVDALDTSLWIWMWDVPISQPHKTL
jgi:hypothetical protein